MHPIPLEGQPLPGNVIFADFRARRVGISPPAATWAGAPPAPPAPAPDDGEDDEIPNEPKDH